MSQTIPASSMINFYPRSPCGERPCAHHRSSLRIEHFYPRSPCGERHFRSSIKRAICNFYPRSPCGERHDWPPVRDIIQWISIHALLAESDETQKPKPSRQNQFLSTLSLRRATRRISSIINNVIDNFYPRSPCGERPVQIVVVIVYALISIHALLAESDC